jgi:hypothetical protein
VRLSPLLREVEWVRGIRVRLFFSNGQVSEVALPVRSSKIAKRARIVDGGVGLDPGDGRERSSLWLYERKGKILCRGRKTMPRGGWGVVPE